MRSARRESASVWLGVALAVALAPAPAWGWGAGISGYSGHNGATCTECHFGGTAPSVLLRGPAILVAGQAGLYTLDVVTGASTAKVGFDVAASAGSLSTVAGQPNESWIDDGELAHTKNWPSGETVQLQFRFTAPADPGPLTLYLAALRSDGVDDRGGDGTASTTLAVDVVASEELDDLGDSFDLAMVDAVSGATTVQATPRPDAGPPRDEARWACDCQIARAAGFPDAGSLLLLIVAISIWNLARSRV
ncbi:MAG: Transrane Gly-Cys-Arg domain protein [Myxococcales bacterium]|nr:Transrane Gly-Cys-Arg domain protein [Myxococcales bacterium]